jgi:hypothetical protein
MGNLQPNSVRKINFEDVLISISDSNTIIINTMTNDSQSCLIDKTVSYLRETELLNTLLSSSKTNVRIVIYGMNSCDESIVLKYNQLNKLGFTNIHVYVGGLFEWMLLQDIYGDEMFKTTKKEMDILKFKGPSKLNLLLLEHCG